MLPVVIWESHGLQECSLRQPGRSREHETSFRFGNLMTTQGIVPMLGDATMLEDAP